MADSAREAPALIAAAAADAGEQLQRRPKTGRAPRGELSATSAAPEPADAGGAEPELAAAGDDLDLDALFRGRPDLSQDTIEELRSKNRALKLEQRKVRSQLKNQAKKRTRIMKKMRHLDTAAVLQVLMERGVDFSHAPGGASAASSAAALPAASASHRAPAKSSTG